MNEYVFTCTNRKCQCLKEGVGLYFNTNDLEKAEEHSRENDSPMWVSKKENFNSGIAYKINLINIVTHHKKHCKEENCNISLLLLLDMALKSGITFTEDEKRLFV